MGEKICFRVVKEPYGWAVRMGEGMMTPFQSQTMAIQHASGIVEALRRRGEFAEVIIEQTVCAPPRANGRSWSSFLRA